MCWVSGSPWPSPDPLFRGSGSRLTPGADVTTRGCYSGVSRHSLRPAASLPANTRCWTNDRLMLGQRRGRWANINPTLVQRLVVCWGRAAWSPRGKNQTLHWIGVIRLRKWKAAASPLLITRAEMGGGVLGVMWTCPIISAAEVAWWHLITSGVHNSISNPPIPIGCVFQLQFSFTSSRWGWKFKFG